MNVKVIGLDVDGNVRPDGHYQINSVDAVAIDTNTIVGTCNALNIVIADDSDKGKDYIYSLCRFLNSHPDYTIVTSSNSDIIGLLLGKIVSVCKTRGNRMLRCGNIYTILEVLQIDATTHEDIRTYVTDSGYECVKLCDVASANSVYDAVAYICIKNDIEHIICG